MTEHAGRAPRRWLYIPFIIAGIILFGYFLLWRAGAAEMKKAVHAWVDDQRQQGLVVDHGRITADGFPFFLRVHVAAPDISAPGLWRWSAERLSLDALPYDLNRLILSPEGMQQFSADGFGAWRGRAADLRASIGRDKTRGWVFSMTVGDWSAARASDAASAHLDKLVFDLAPDAEDPSTLTLNLAGQGLEARAKGETYALSDLRLSVALTDVDLLSEANAAANWRAAGGELLISGLYAEIEAAKISMSGAVSLDDRNRPAGTLKTEIANPAGLARLLEKTGAMTPDQAQQTAAGLSLTAIANGGKVAAPIELQDGAVRLAGVKIADLKPID